MSETTEMFDLPPVLRTELQKAAAEEKRPAGELVQDAVQQFLAERRWFRRDAAHDKIARGLESLRQGKGLDGEAVMAELLAELDSSQLAR